MKHGMSGTRFYQIWSSIQQRCYYPQHNRFKNYGGRGIKCLWTSFEDFRKDMYASYLVHLKKFGEKNTTIDRKDSNGDYCLANCKWNTLWNQNLNRTNNHLLTYKGITKPLTQWAREKRFKRGLLENRIRRGWSVEKMLETKSIEKFSPIKKNTRKSDCPFCNASSGSAHKVGCKEIERLRLGKRVTKYSNNEIITR